MKKQKYIVFIIMLITFMTFFSIDCSAEDSLGTEGLIENLPEEGRDTLFGMGIDEVSDSFDFSFENIFSVMSDAIRAKYLNPLRVLAITIALIAITSFINSLNDEISALVQLAGAISICVVTLPHVLSLISGTLVITESVSVFVLAAIPIYAVLFVAGGNPAISGSFSAISLFTANAFTALCNGIIIPSLSIFLGLSISSAFSHLNIKSLCDSVYKCIKWILVSAITLFSTIISMQTALSGATDQLTTKTIKILAGSAVPIVGSALGDSVVAVQNSVKLLKSGAGAFGIIACVSIFIAPIIELVLWLFAFNISSIAADFFAYKKVNEVLSVLIIIIKILLAVLISFCVISIVISAITLFFGA